MKNHHEVGHFKNRLMIGLLSLCAIIVMAGQSFAATTCSTCHGMPPLDSVDGSRNPATGAFKGSHQVHVAGPAVADDCVECHGGASDYDMSHSATSKNVIRMSEGIYTKGTFFNQTSIPLSPLGTCSNVSCHSNVYAEGFINSPPWGSTGNGCSACHSTPIGANGPATGSHTISAHSVDCTECHAAGTTATTHATVANGHTNGVIDVVNVGYPAGKAKGSAPDSCTTASCHPNVYGTGSATTPVWGTTNNKCSACHTAPIGASGPNTGKHAVHAAYDCTECHAAGTTETTAPSNSNGHIDGNIDIYGVGYATDVTKHAAGTYASSCSAARCHSNGAATGRLYTNPSWNSANNTNTVGCRFCHPTLSAGHGKHVGDLFDVGTPVSFYGYTSSKSAGVDYKFGCANCHPLLVSNHLNNTIDVVLTVNAAGGHLKAQNGPGALINASKECSNVYCHSNGYTADIKFAATPAWGGTFPEDRCANCHGNSPNATITGSPAHSAHLVGIHYDDIYNGVSGKLPLGGGELVNAAHGRNNRSTTINCNVCHAATVTSFANDNNTLCKSCHQGTTAPLMGNAAIASAAKHVNGTVDISFIGQTIATKAQVAPSAFAAYTAASTGGWTRNNNLYKTYTSAYDVTRAPLSASPVYTPAAGCAVACHSNVVVKWTDTISCENCHTRLK